MKRIKKFNELFDTGELRDNPEHELSKITGDPSYILDTSIPMMTFKDDTITNVISKISYLKFPFFRAFLDATDQEDGKLEFDGFSIGMKWDGENKSHNLLVFSETNLLTISLKIKNLNNYDVFIASDELENEENFKSLEVEGVDMNQLVDIIHDAYLPELEELDFSELTYYNYEDYLSINN
jgi:hypothetical protein